MQLLIVEAFPVQYRAPVYRHLTTLAKAAGLDGAVKVLYSTDRSATGYRDVDFGAQVSWGDEALAGYDYDVMGNHRGGDLAGGLAAHSWRGVWSYIRARRPRAVLLTSFATQFELMSFAAAKLSGAEGWIRTETQDECLARSPAKAFVRSLIYRFLYGFLDRFFYIGQLNRKHYLAHGVPERKLVFAPYCVEDRWRNLPIEDPAFREATRRELGIPGDAHVLMFSGKLIEKKNPLLILRAISRLNAEERSGLHVLFCGSGTLQPELERYLAEYLPDQSHTFAGFVTQTDLYKYYVAADCMILPSRQMGETWGLVVNEALLAGCKVAVSNFVGSGADFKGMDGFHIFGDDDAEELARVIAEEMRGPHDRAAIRRGVLGHTVEKAAEALFGELVRVCSASVPGGV